jgi:predicted lipoprotein
MHRLTTSTNPLLIAIALLVLAVGCGGQLPDTGGGGGDPDPDPDPDPVGGPVPDPAIADPGAVETYSDAAMLKDLAVNVVYPVYDRFDARARTLAYYVAAYCAAPDNATAKTAALDAWKKAIETWEMAELFQFNLSTTTTEGRTQRDFVYSWPKTSTCEIDKVVAAGYSNQNNFNIGNQTVDGRGLWAIEYALFKDTSDCASGSSADASKLEARCHYAQAAAEDLVALAATYKADWTPGSGQRSKDFVNLGQGAFANAEAGATSMFWAMFYIDKKTWELKLNQTSGAQQVKNNAEANPNCTAKKPCLAALESQYADVSKEHIYNNLLGFEMLFRGLTLAGQDRLGFDDMMTSRGTSPSDMISSIASTKSAVQALSGSLKSLIESGSNEPSKLSQTMKNITGGMKSTVVKAVGLTAPPSVGQDGD